MVTEPVLTWESLERQDWHLWILAILLLLVFGCGLLSFMAPSAFWFAQEMAIREPQRAFIGFCVLAVIALLYMLHRQRTMRGLRRELYLAMLAAVDAERKRFIAVLESLPGTVQFHDSLAMEYRRASTSQLPLALAIFSIGSDSKVQQGQVADVLRHSIRHGEGLFRLSSTGLAMVLPEMPLAKAQEFVARIAQQLQERWPALGIRQDVNGYPEGAAAFSELEEMLKDHRQPVPESLSSDAA